MEKGHAANLFTTIQNNQMYAFKYVPKRRSGTIYRSFSLQTEIVNRAVELTQGQGVLNGIALEPVVDPSLAQLHPNLHAFVARLKHMSIGGF